MNIKIDKWYEELSLEKLQKKGYLPVGKPALIARVTNHLTDSVLEQAVLDANCDNRDLEVNACVLYLKGNIEQRTPDMTRSMKIMDYPDTQTYFTVVQPLKRINLKK